MRQKQIRSSGMKAAHDKYERDMHTHRQRSGQTNYAREAMAKSKAAKAYAKLPAAKQPVARGRIGVGATTRVGLMRNQMVKTLKSGKKR